MRGFARASFPWCRAERAPRKVRDATSATERFAERMPALIKTLAAKLPRDQMSAFPSDRPRSKFPIVVVVILIVIAAIAGGAYYLRPRFESAPPQITVSPDVDVLGVAPLEIQVTDAGDRLEIRHGDVVSRGDPSIASPPSSSTDP